jgi:hypothetical protein
MAQHSPAKLRKPGCMKFLAQCRLLSPYQGGRMVVGVLRRVKASFDRSN